MGAPRILRGVALPPWGWGPTAQRAGCPERVSRRGELPGGQGPPPEATSRSAPALLEQAQVVERPDLHEGPADDGAFVDGVEERRVPRVLPVVAQDVDLV